MVQLVSFIKFNEEYRRARWPITKFWTTFHDANEKGRLEGYTDETIFEVLKSSPYENGWTDDNSYSYTKTNYDFQNALNEKDIKYFKPFLDKLFVDGYSPARIHKSVNTKKRSNSVDSRRRSSVDSRRSSRRSRNYTRSRRSRSVDGSRSRGGRSSRKNKFDISPV